MALFKVNKKQIKIIHNKKEYIYPIIKSTYIMGTYGPNNMVANLTDKVIEHSFVEKSSKTLKTLALLHEVGHLLTIKDHKIKLYNKENYLDRLDKEFEAWKFALNKFIRSRPPATQKTVDSIKKCYDYFNTYLKDSELFGVEIPKKLINKYKLIFDEAINKVSSYRITYNKIRKGNIDIDVEIDIHKPKGQATINQV